MDAIRIKAGDTIPMTASLKDGNGAPVNLTGATVSGRVMKAPSGAFHMVGSASIVGDPLLGQVSLPLSGAQTASAGSYFVEWFVTFAGGTLQRFPGSSYNEIVIDPAVPAS